MAFTERELEISNKSYTNKDFAAIYEELLTIAEKLSDRFSPITAVETDPFIVILKLASFIADKVNYQVDKNLLERFILSCTQEQSMRELTETLGYNMHYYTAAETDLVFSYKLSSPLTSDISLPRFTIVESASKIPYITTTRSYINKDTKVSAAVPAIQGKVQALTVLGNEIIQLENLNANNRLYFPELMVAENGIFIDNSVSSEWLKVDNLNTQTYGATRYKFGFDSKRNLPYIEFPDWIADIIGDGLTVKYVVTQGSVGNVAAKELSIIKGGIDTPDNIRVINLSASFSGADPETIDQSYLGFKKVIGTFDTLITCRDYANAIYNMLLNSSPAVSNVQVADRRTDINFACDVVTFTPELGTTFEAIPIKELKSGDSIRTDAITPYDLVVYPLTPITNTAVSAINSITNGFNKSFSFLNQQDINSITATLENVDEYKTMSHTFKELKDADITSIQNFYDLTATISTTVKVNIVEQTDIITNIYGALVKEFNARKLNFGHEIPFNELLVIMEEADMRIKAVSLQEPLQTPKIITKGNAENVAHDIYDGDDDSDQFKFIVAKNVLAGRAALYEYDLDFSYGYDYATAEKIVDVKKLTTNCNIAPVAADGSIYTLLDNEVFQFLAPNLVTDKVYTAGVYYHLSLSSGDDFIPANTDYELKSDDVLKFFYVQKEIPIVDTITAAKIISAKTNLYTTEYLTGDGRTPKEHLDFAYHGILSGDEIKVKKINSEEIKEPKKCYWITNKKDNEIGWLTVGTTSEYILQENEYFFYSDLNLTSLFAFGSGTKLTIPDTAAAWDWTCKTDINIDDITLEGIYALNDAFEILTFSETDKLTIVENEILTLTAGDSIKNMDSNVFTVPDNTFTPFAGNEKIEYKHKVDTQYKTLQDKSSISTGNWSRRALLDINCGPDLEQKLGGTQTVRYQAGESTTAITLPSASILKFNILIQRGGGVDLDLGYVTINDLEKNVYPTMLSVTKDTSSIEKTLDGMYRPEFNNEPDAKFYAPISSETIFPYVMIYAKGITSTATATLTAYKNDHTPTGTPFDINEGLNIYKLEATDAAYWKLTKSSAEADILFTMSPLKYVKGLNALLGLKTNLANFIRYMEETFEEQYPKFYSIADLDPNKQIELSENYPLSHAQAFYDSNNIANKWVLPKIDFSAIKIKIARSSTK